ncbi:uncharacterized protein LOC131943988 isoform X2 [Physella acuta]|uniref:uncharacterized protein LOC131943988 isoform X2 n=1 Tax=Physella acuta TaxID=109671 RepID=UPI0027DAD030|nr:uncharacterized protein LOC131943988 isoform X2 [Physella acuta]
MSPVVRPRFSTFLLRKMIYFLLLILCGLCLQVAGQDSTYDCQVSQGREVNAADENCASYYECTDYVGELRRCRRGQRFDTSDQVCKPSSEVRCNRQRSGSRRTTSKPLETTTTPLPTSTTTEAAPRSKRPGLVSLLGALLPQFGGGVGGAGILGLNGNAALAPVPFNDGGYQPVNQGPAFFNAAPNFGNTGAFNGFPQQTNFFPYPNTNQFGFSGAFGNPQPQFSNNGFGTPPFSNNGFGTPQFSNNGFGTPQFSNNGFGTPQFSNNGFGTPQFSNNGFGNQASVEVENPVQPIVVHLQPYPPQVQTPATPNPGQQNVLTDLSGGGHKVPDQVYQPSNHSPAEFFPAIKQVGNLQASPKASGTVLPADSSRNKREALREHLMRSLKAMPSSDKNKPNEQSDTQLDRKASESIHSLPDLFRQAIGMFPSLESLAQTLDINFDAVKLAKHVISQFYTVRHGLSDFISDKDVSYVQKLADEIRRIEGSLSEKQDLDLVLEKPSSRREPGSKSLQPPHKLGQLKPKIYDHISSGNTAPHEDSTTFSAYFPQSAVNQHNSPPSKVSHMPAQRDSRYRPTKYRPRIDQLPPQQLEQPRYYLPATGQFSSQYQPKYYKQHTKHMPALPSVHQGHTHTWNTPVDNRHHSKFSSRTYNSKGYPRMRTQLQPTYEPLPSTNDASVLPRYYTSPRADLLETPLMDNNGLSSINLSESNPKQTLKQLMHYPPSRGHYKKLDQEPQNKLHTNSSSSADDNIRLTLQSQVTLQLKNLKMPIILNTDGRRIDFAMNGNENKP